jgi:CheY-like chemotaxis protein
VSTSKTAHNTEHGTRPAPAAPSAPTQGPGSLTVLVADDEEGMRDLVTEVLRERGYRVLAARDGEEAIALAESEDLQIDCVVTDEVMPRVRGSMLATRVRLRWARVPILFISGQFVDARRLESELGNGVALLRKPFTPHMLLEELDALFGRTRRDA